ncbi:MAG: ankyrin repeat domain-containing protein [Spirochaetia bacterium]|jgi:hypothetical protein|nr:ankyrin repeat domain-containing protein [Spirochaetia bacterium]
MDSLTEIIKSSETGATDKLKTLLVTNSDIIDTPGNDGATPLFAALKSNQPEAVELLLNHGASKSSLTEDGISPLEWAKKQPKHEASSVLLAWDYLDRLYEASGIWKKHGIKEAYCDVCTALITEEESTMLRMDEVFTEGLYTEKLISQAVKTFPAELEKMDKKDILKEIRKQIENLSITGRYFVCNQCMGKFFIPVIFGENMELVFEIVDSMFDNQEKGSM